MARRERTLAAAAQTRRTDSTDELATTLLLSTSPFVSHPSQTDRPTRRGSPSAVAATGGSRSRGNSRVTVVPASTSLSMVTAHPIDERILDLGQTDPVPLLISLVVKNGSKTRACTSGGMPVPVSATDADEVSGRHQVAVGGDVLRRDRDDAPPRHGVAGVDAEIQIASSISPGSALTGQTSDPTRLDHDLSAQGRVEHRPHALQMRGDVDRFRVVRPAAPEREYLPGEPRRRVGGRIASSFARRAARRSGRAAARPLANTASRLLKSCATPPVSGRALHLLRLAQRVLGLAQPLLVAQAVGHVVDELVGADAVADRVAQRAEAHLVGAAVAAGSPNSSIAVNSSPASARLHTAFTRPGARAGPPESRACCRRPSGARRRCARTRPPRRG